MTIRYRLFGIPGNFEEFIHKAERKNIKGVNIKATFDWEQIDNGVPPTTDYVYSFDGRIYTSFNIDSFFKNKTLIYSSKYDGSDSFLIREIDYENIIKSDNYENVIIRGLIKKLALKREEFYKRILDHGFECNNITRNSINSILSKITEYDLSREVSEDQGKSKSEKSHIINPWIEIDEIK